MLRNFCILVKNRVPSTFLFRTEFKPNVQYEKVEGQILVTRCKDEIY